MHADTAPSAAPLEPADAETTDAEATGTGRGTRFMTPGDVLRRWRADVLRLPLGVAAEQVTVSRGHLANMESGARTVPRVMAEYLDNGYGAGGVLKELIRASLTTALPPRNLWPHNFAHPPQRVWMWLRAAAPNTPALITWGPLSLSINAVPFPDGVIVTAPTSLPNPPAEVHFDPTTGLGWAAFGAGTVPEAFGVPLLDGAGAMATPPWDDPSGVARMQSLLSQYWHQVLDLAGYFQIRHRDVIRHLATVVPVDQPLTVAPSTTDVAATPGSPEVRLITGQQLRNLRLAAGWKETELAAQINTLPGVEEPVSDDDIDGAESDRRSRHRFLLAMMDLTLGLDGRSCLSPVTVDAPIRGRVKVRFPRFWTGPIYLRFAAAAANSPQRRAVLTWGPWCRRLNVASGAVVTTRRATVDAEPLLVEVPAGWTVVAGLGWPPGAHDVGEGWRPAGIPGMHRLLGDWIAAIRAQRQTEEGQRATTPQPPI